MTLPTSYGVADFDQRTVASFLSPWSVTFVPDGRLIVTMNPPSVSGQMLIVTQAGGVSTPVSGVPNNAGLLDVTLDPNFAQTTSSTSAMARATPLRRGSDAVRTRRRTSRSA